MPFFVHAAAAAAAVATVAIAGYECCGDGTQVLWLGMRNALLDAHLLGDSGGDGAIRCDGRKFDELRSLEAHMDVLPSVHGSGLFRRGNTEVHRAG